MMRSYGEILVLDPSLRDRHSHHHAVTSGVEKAVRARGGDVRVFAHMSADPAIFEYPLYPAFTRSIYDDSGAQDDKSYSRLVRALADDLSRIEGGFAGHSLLVHSCTAAFAQAIAEVLSKQAASPKVLALQLMFHPESFSRAEPRQRFADKRYARAISTLRRLSRKNGMTLHLSTSCRSFAEHFGTLLGETIPCHPAVSHHVRLAGGPARDTIRNVLLSAGDPKAEKGFFWIVDALPRLLAARPDLTFWIHAGANRFGSPDIDAALARLSSLGHASAHLKVISGFLEDDEWARLLARMDAVLLPYSPAAFAYRSSGVFWEALSCMAPSSRVVVSRGTWMERECEDANIPFTPVTFSDSTDLEECLRGLENATPVGDLKTQNPAWWHGCFGQTNAEFLLNALFDPGLDDRLKFMEQPAAWWRAQQALGKSRAASHGRTDKPLLLYSPGATLNSYQQLLYSEAQAFGLELLALAVPDPVSPPLVSATCQRPAFFHQHWLKDIYWDAGSEEEGELRIKRHLGVLRALKGFGVRILWTLHNLEEHDATELQTALGRQMLRAMAHCADQVFCHTEGAIRALCVAAGVDVSGKSRVVPHPLYDDILSIGEGTLPPELGHVIPPRIWLMTGLLRPYKGTQELLQAWLRIMASHADRPVRLVVAGHIQDPALHPVIAAIRSHSPGSLSVIPRRLEDAELAALLRRSELIVAPYRKVLTSGTYYLASTFSKPVLAPAKGMFPEVVEHGRSGWLYDGSEEELEQSLRSLMWEPPETFRQVGSEARRRNEDANASAVSRRFFEWLLSLQD
jgi:glycosyltransferase involved in cell wall biosynthesis